MFVRSFCFLAVMCSTAIPTFSQTLAEQVIKLPQFFMPPLELESPELYQVRCFDSGQNAVPLSHHAFLDVITRCECYTNNDSMELLFTYVRLSPILWERTDHRDHGRSRLFVDKPGQIFKTDTAVKLAGHYSEGKVVQYYKLHPCQ